MIKKNKGKVILTILTPILLLGTYGCSSVELGEEEENQVIEYAVNVIVNHDKNYIIKLPERTTEIETTTWWSEGDPTKNTEGNEEITTSKDNNDQINNVTMNEALNLSGFSVSYDGYTVTKKYPDDNLGFSMVATSKSNLLVLKFSVKNDSASEANLNINNIYRYRCIINGSSKVNAQVTALLNALNTWDGNLAGGETKEMVLVFQISEEVSDNINKINLSIVKDKETKTVTIKE